MENPVAGDQRRSLLLAFNRLLSPSKPDGSGDLLCSGELQCISELVYLSSGVCVLLGAVLVSARLLRRRVTPWGDARG